MFRDPRSGELPGWPTNCDDSSIADFARRGLRPHTWPPPARIFHSQVENSKGGEQLSSNAAQVEQVSRKGARSPRACEFCGAVFIPRDLRQRFCSRRHCDLAKHRRNCDGCGASCVGRFCRECVLAAAEARRRRTAEMFMAGALLHEIAPELDMAVAGVSDQLLVLRRQGWTIPPGLRGATLPAGTVVPPRGDRHDRACEYCGEVFTPNRSNQRYCSIRHKELAHKRRILAATKGGER